MHQIEISKILMQAQFFQWKRINLKTKKEEISLVQGALRPTLFGAYEYVFPEEALPDVLAMLGVCDEKDDFQRKGGLRLTMVRKLFGCKKIPKEVFKKAAKIDKTIMIKGTNRGLSHCIVGGVATHLIGIKDDNRQKWEDVGFEQEML